MKRFFRKIGRKDDSGQTISESVISMLLICLILFGLLQIFYLSVAQMVTDFSAFYTARSRAVGFADYLVHRQARVTSIAASGNMVYPQDGWNSPISQFGSESFNIPEYCQGIRWMEYEYWYSDNNDTETSFGSSSTSSGLMVEAHVGFNEYPLNFPMRRAFTPSESTDLGAEAEVKDYSFDYLE